MRKKRVFPSKRYFGYKQNPPDDRDIRYRGPRFKKPPGLSDLKPIVLPVEDQSVLGSCVGNGGTTQLETMWVKMGRPFTQMSRLGLYWLARFLAGNVGEDAGCYPRDMAKALVKFGCPEESLHPYNTRKYKERPSDAAMENALAYRVEKYYWPKSLNDIKWALSRGYPVGVGIQVFPCFENPINGIVSMPPEDSENLGLHWIVICGHNDATSYFDIVNSWGVSYGNNGFAKIPYKYIEKYGSDYLVLELGINAPGFDPSPDLGVKWYIPVPLSKLWQWVKQLLTKQA